MLEHRIVIKRTTLTIAAIFIGALLAGCDSTEPPPVDVLYATRGIFTPDENNDLKYTATNIVPLQPGQRYGWYVRLRTNREKIRFVEEVEMAGPTTWPEARSGFTVSEDKRSARVEREIDSARGYVSTVWVLNADDPEGPVKIKVTIEGKVFRNFDFVLKKNSAAIETERPRIKAGLAQPATDKKTPTPIGVDSTAPPFFSDNDCEENLHYLSSHGNPKGFSRGKTKSQGQHTKH
jgi:hypothetical protein